jgi:nitrite reductase (NADH) large subunit
MPGGVCTPEEPAHRRRRRQSSVPLVKVTGGQRIDLVGVPKDQLPAVWKDLGMPAGRLGKSYRTCKSCIGIEFCRLSGRQHGPRAQDREALPQHRQSRQARLATAGCPRNCSEALIKDVGAVAIGGSGDLCRRLRGSHVRKGDLLCVVDNEDDVPRYRPLHAVLPRAAKWRAPTPSSSASASSASVQW